MHMHEMDESEQRKFVQEYIRSDLNNSLQDVSIQENRASAKKARKHDEYETPKKQQSKRDGRAAGTIDAFAQDLVNSCLKDGLEGASSNAINRKRILSVGIVCLDLISICDKFPDEDSETLVEEHYWSRGGNGSNTATVLAHLGACTEFLGTLVKGQTLEFLTNDFKRNGVLIDHCVYLEPDCHKSPTSVVLVSRSTGSRTALPDFKGVTELSFEQFDSLDLGIYKWIHFEGRANNPDIPSMMDKVMAYNEGKIQEHKVKISVEIEHPNSLCPKLVHLFPKADVILMSKDYARDAGCSTKEEAVKMMYPKCKQGAILFCAWGELGAAAMSSEGVMTSSAFPPGSLVDTIGAGDTFNASAVFALSLGVTVKEALTFACKIAGAKCGSRGFSCVKEIRQRFR